MRQATAARLPRRMAVAHLTSTASLMAVGGGQLTRHGASASCHAPILAQNQHHHLAAQRRWCSSSRFSRSKPITSDDGHTSSSPPPVPSPATMASIMNATQLITALQQLRHAYRCAATEAQRLRCADALAAIRLREVRQIDERTLVQLLELGAMLGMTDAPLVEHVVQWMLAHAPIISSAQSLRMVAALTEMNFTATHTLILSSLGEHMEHIARGGHDMEVCTNTLMMILHAMRCSTYVLPPLLNMAERMRDGVLHTSDPTTLTCSVRLLAALHSCSSGDDCPAYLIHVLRTPTWMMLRRRMQTLAMNATLAEASNEAALMLAHVVVGTSATTLDGATAEWRAAMLPRVVEDLAARAGHVKSEAQLLHMWEVAVQVSVDGTPATMEWRNVLQNELQRRLDATTVATDRYPLAVLAAHAWMMVLPVATTPPFLMKVVNEVAANVANLLPTSMRRACLHPLMQILVARGDGATLVAQLAEQHLRMLEKMGTTGGGEAVMEAEAVLPIDIVPLLVEESATARYADRLMALLTPRLRTWSAHQALTMLQHLSTLKGKPARAVLRSAAITLTDHVAAASTEQLCALMHFYGRAGVRNDAFCEAVATRLRLLLRSNDVSLEQLSLLLGSFAAVEYRDVAPFVDAAPRVLELVVSSTSAESVTYLLVAYAKQMIWQFRVMWSLADRMVALEAELDLRQMMVGQLALIRMDTHHPRYTNMFLAHLQAACGADCVGEGHHHDHPVRRSHHAEDNRVLLQQDAVVLLSVLSRLPSPLTEEEMESVCRPITKLLEPRAADLRADEVAEVLLSMARLGISSCLLFEELSLRALGLVPTAPPLVVAHLTSAFSLAKRSDAELYCLVAERVISTKAEISAPTIAQILSAFAQAGVRNDRLFIEMIPRVRHIANYGTPTDIVHVVDAYAQVKLWHYKLFAKLGDRAVSLRAEFRCPLIARLLAAYASVGMRYERVFVDFSPRVQTVAHLMSAEEASSVASSYATLQMPATGVYRVCADRLAELMTAATEEQVRTLLQALSAMSISHVAVFEAVTRKFPSLAEEFASVGEEKAAAKTGEDGSAATNPPK